VPGICYSLIENEEIGDIMEIKGFKFSAVEAAIKKPGRLDLALIFSEEPAVTAAVFTTNRVKAAPVLVDMKRVKSGPCQAIVVNSGNANACTGGQGMDDALMTTRLVAEGLGIPDEATLVASTGVIGVPMPMERLLPRIPALVEGLAEGSLEEVAQAIMTTDTFPKLGRHSQGGRDDHAQHGNHALVSGHRCGS
jgi:glutamate N-acetyltransferase/amino-acid N-acetyltransferase